MRKEFVIVSTFLLFILGAVSYFNSSYLWGIAIVAPFIVLGFYDMIQTRHSIMRTYPIFGRGRYWMEALRPKIFQYFVESDTDGRPLNRILRSVVYQRAKHDLATVPFGTQKDVNEIGYEWINHSIYAFKHEDINHDSLRVKVGGKDCLKPYLLSRLNISAMSFGSLSSHAILALNKGAKAGGFAHNTGEGGMSPHHLKYGGDLIWQIGTGYFGCRTKDGQFSKEEFKEKACLKNVKMIEIKLSQGAKPGHGGILPAIKNTPEIAKIRGVESGVMVLSPPTHSAFNSPETLLSFIANLRELSGGKPIGFKLCFGKPSEFEEICKAMVKTGIKPDFITVDGGEGGTGAAPLEFTDSVGMGLRDGLIFTTDYLSKYDLKKDIKIIASGKILSAFQMVKSIALGADSCNSARAMMLALGCIQALQCNQNVCPTGVATQDPHLEAGLVVEQKYKRIQNFHEATIIAMSEIIAACGIRSPDELNRSHIWRRISIAEIKNYEELFPSL